MGVGLAKIMASIAALVAKAEEGEKFASVMGIDPSVSL